jgi:beta-galactosidase
MEQAHMHVVRVGEFAWSTMEPAEGRFEFGWLDRAIALAAKHEIKVVLGTPTAAPPAWLTTKYPETLRVEEDGHRAEHGNRQQFSANDPHYRVLAARIAHEMAARYGHNPNVLGWQIDNEIGAPTFDNSALRQWHLWLQAKYKTVAELNRRWATAYWSQTYDTFDEVPYRPRGENPALLLDYKHFVTDTWTAYVQNQIDAIRPLIAPGQFITTNTMHWYSVYDHYQLHRTLSSAAISSATSG